jgi:hypothetical protein
VPEEIAEKQPDQWEGLPTELKGKSPKEIAEYYQERERILAERVRQHEAPLPAKQDEEKFELKFDLFNDPEGSVTRKVDQKVGEKIKQVTDVAAPGLVAAARMTVRDAHSDYAKFSQEVERIMSGMTVESQMNPQFWEIAYLTAKGKAADRMVQEAVTQATTVVEKPTPGGGEPPKPRELTAQERDIADRLGLTDEAYRKSLTRFEAEDGRLPVTVDSRRPRERRAAANGRK